jgi:hypothetical protein
MLGALAVAALTIACSAVVGEAIAALLRLERRRGWSPVAGLALLLCVALAAAKLPGHGTTAAVAVALTVAAAIGAVLSRRASLRPDADAAAAGLLAAAAACIPYVASGRFGIPGVSFNNDASSHLAWATALQDPGLAAVVQPTAGYPVGPHSLMAALSSGTGLGLDHVLAGLLIALPALIAWAALPLLDGLSRPRRALAALLVASAYLVSAFYAQAGFKELLLIADLLALVGITREVARGRLAPSLSTGALTGVLLAGIVVSISYGGLAWPVAMLATWAAAATAVALLDGQRRELLARVRASLSPRRGAVAMAIGAGIAALLLLAPDVPRLIDSLSLFGSSPAGAGSITNENIGHLAGPLSKYEVFGFWPLADFRFRIAETWRNGALLGLAIAAATFGGVWWVRGVAPPPPPPRGPVRLGGVGGADALPRPNRVGLRRQQGLRGRGCVHDAACRQGPAGLVAGAHRPAGAAARAGGGGRAVRRRRALLELPGARGRSRRGAGARRRPGDAARDDRRRADDLHGGGRLRRL